MFSNTVGLFSNFMSANFGLAYGLAVAEVISKTAILLLIFHIIITLLVMITVAN